MAQCRCQGQAFVIAEDNTAIQKVGLRQGGFSVDAPTPVGLKHDSDRRETLPKRVLDDPRQVNFWPKQFLFAQIFGVENRFTPSWCNFAGSTERRTYRQIPRSFSL